MRNWSSSPSDPEPASPPLIAGVVYGIDPIDASGRIGDRAVTSALGRRSRDRLTVTADGGPITARRDPHGLATIPARHYMAIPAALLLERMG
jgi:hypothetical protein